MRLQLVLYTSLREKTVKDRLSRLEARVKCPKSRVEARVMKKEIGAVIKKTGKRWEIRAWGPLPPPEKPETSEKPDRGKAKVVLLIMAALAVAVLGLVILLVVRSAPEWGELLRKLVALAILSLGCSGR
jgi:hypothetical protein